MAKELEPPPADLDENPEWTAEDFDRARPFSDAHPEFFAAWQKEKNKGGRPKVEHPRAHIAFRWDPDLVAHIKATGKGYNARVEKIMRNALAKGEL